MKYAINLACLTLAFLVSYSAHADLSGRVGVESRYFISEAAVSDEISGSSDTQNSQFQNGVFVEPEWYWESESGDDSFTFEVFARYDDLDDERTHMDIREALWIHVGSDWEFRAGLGKVFWGVTESNHLVDVINQTDLVESPDGEQKLGQPLLQYTAIKDWGVIDAFILPGFRERTFAGEDGRLRGDWVVDSSDPMYESEQEEKHIDVALRYFHSISIFDLGLSMFNGTNRDPKFRLIGEGDDARLVPYYDQMQQFGLDVQATVGDWLLKLEAIQREDSIDNYLASVAGFEYTFVNMFQSGLDFGALMEYNYDARDASPSPLDNDVFVGGRLTFNDQQSTDLLIGFSHDLDTNGQLVFAEGSRRLGENWKLTLDARGFSSNNETDPLYQLRNEDYASMSLEFYY